MAMGRKKRPGRPRRGTPVVPFYCRLDVGLYVAVDTCAREWGISKCALVNNALAVYFENMGIDVPKASGIE